MATHLFLTIWRYSLWVFLSCDTLSNSIHSFDCTKVLDFPFFYPKMNDKLAIDLVEFLFAWHKFCFDCQSFIYDTFWVPMISNEDKNENQNEIKTEDVHTRYEWIMRQLHFNDHPFVNHTNLCAFGSKLLIDNI